MLIFPGKPIPQMIEPVSTPSATPKVYRPRALGALARVGLSLISFALVLLFMRSMAAPGGGSVIGGKLEYWRRHGGEYDTVFLGSSHVFRAFVPAEFDAASESHGLRTRSFNFGVQAVHLLEQRYLLGQILDAHPGLERVFFEYQWLTPQLDPQNAFTPRSVYWHDLETTRLAMQRAMHWEREMGDAFSFVETEAERHSLLTVLDRTLSPGVRSAEQHGQHYLLDLLLIGRGKDVLRGILGRDHGQTARYRAGDGYISLEADEQALEARGQLDNSYRARRERFLNDLTSYRESIDRLDEEERSFGDAEWVNAEVARIDDFDLIAQIAREVRSRGVEFVLVFLPSQSGHRSFEERAMEELGEPVLRYNVPGRYPELYEPRSRFDSGHLTAEGALYFSRLLARDYAGLGRGAADEREEVVQ